MGRLRERMRRCWSAPPPWDRSFYDEQLPWYCGVVRGAIAAAMRNWRTLIGPFIAVLLALLAAIL